MPIASLHMLPHLVPTANRLLFANAMAHNIVLFGASLRGLLIPFLTCSNLAPSLTPDTHVYKYTGSFSLLKFMPASVFLS